jgi:hypothetical protein
MLDGFDQARAGDRSGLLWKVLGANPLRHLERDRVRRHAHIYTFSTRVIDDPLVIEL